MSCSWVCSDLSESRKDEALPIRLFLDLKHKSRFQTRSQGTPLVVQWLRIRLPVQGTWVPSLAEELWSHMLGGKEGTRSYYWVLMPQWRPSTANKNKQTQIQKALKKNVRKCKKIWSLVSNGRMEITQEKNKEWLGFPINKVIILSTVLNRNGGNFFLRLLDLC